jgi:hypothetical protein
MKIFFLGFVSLIAVFTAKADYLYWMVGDEYKGGGGETTLATLYAINGETKQSLDTVTSTEAVNAWANGEPPDARAAQIGSYSGSEWSYFIELANGLYSESVTYAAALENGMIYVGGLDVPEAGGMSSILGASGGYAAAVPEPTSGLLVLIGGMLLGLRRKRVA